jgi:hypothetical protein
MFRLLGTAILALTLVVASSNFASAQEAPQPGVVAVQYFKCQDVAAFDRIVETAWLPQVRRALEEGRLLSWGQLDHFWGDEWNRVLYNTAADIQTFHAVFDDIFRAVSAEHPEMSRDIARACSEHKDNIYSVARALPAP